MMTVSQLLATSRAKNDEFHLYQQKGMKRECAASVLDAMESRAWAHRMDPKHEDAAWAGDKADDKDIFSFQSAYLNKALR